MKTQLLNNFEKMINFNSQKTARRRFRIRHQPKPISHITFEDLPRTRLLENSTWPINCCKKVLSKCETSTCKLCSSVYMILSIAAQNKFIPKHFNENKITSHNLSLEIREWILTEVLGLKLCFKNVG